MALRRILVVDDSPAVRETVVSCSPATTTSRRCASTSRGQRHSRPPPESDHRCPRGGSRRALPSPRAPRCVDRRRWRHTDRSGGTLDPAPLLAARAAPAGCRAPRRSGGPRSRSAGAQHTAATALRDQRRGARDRPGARYRAATALGGRIWHRQALRCPRHPCGARQWSVPALAGSAFRPALLTIAAGEAARCSSTAPISSAAPHSRRCSATSIRPAASGSPTARRCVCCRRRRRISASKPTAAASLPISSTA